MNREREREEEGVWERKIKGKERKYLSKLKKEGVFFNYQIL